MTLNRWPRSVCVCLIGCFLATSIASSQPPSEIAAGGVPWPATDALGRKIPTSDSVGPARPDRFVGIFYFLWHKQRGGKSPHWNGPYDVAKILARDPSALSKPDSPLWGPVGMYHYWAEPLYGYYRSEDPWVLRRHAHLLADAGIDTLIFDTTNAVTYPDVYNRLCEVFTQVRADGEPTQQIAFMVNTRAGETARKIYEDLYKPGRFRELWFHWQGKPLLICDPEKASDELREFFTLRRAHWPFEMVNTPYAWHWEATYPQVYGYTDDPSRPEQVNVSVAQNLRQGDGKVTNMSEGNARGRSFHDGAMDPSPDGVRHGHNFQEQWRRACDLAPPFVMVTGWNEWIAGRWERPGLPIVFVDQYDQQFSRDIEPMKGGHGDDYYWQLVSNVRRYKGAAPLPRASGPTSIRIEGRFAQWRDVRPDFHDHHRETNPRNFGGAAGLQYTNTTGRNDLIACKVARDQSHIFFYVRTREAITSHTDRHWMRLLIDTDQDAETGWNGYEFVVNHTVGSHESSWLERSDSRGGWERVAQVPYRMEGNQLHLAIPRALLGQPDGTSGVAFDFKWLDNVQSSSDVFDWYVSGDVAPGGRFRYRYSAE